MHPHLAEQPPPSPSQRRESDLYRETDSLDVSSTKHYASSTQGNIMLVSAIQPFAPLSKKKGEKNINIPTFPNPQSNTFFLWSATQDLLLLSTSQWLSRDIKAPYLTKNHHSRVYVLRRHSTGQFSVPSHFKVIII